MKTYWGSGGNACKILFGKHERNSHLGDPSVDGRIFKCILNNQGVRVWISG
jgi:hypothetical protein